MTSIMGVFEMTFLFENRRQLATVSTTRKHDHLQYTIIPQDEDVQERFPVQIFQELPGKRLQPTPEPKTDEAREYADALVTGLSRFLDGTR